MREDEQGKVFQDPYALSLLPEARVMLIKQSLGGCDEDISQALQNIPFASQVLSRSAFVEKEFTASGGAQYVQYGSGLDSFCLRHPEGKNFEMDRPAMMAFKKEQLLRIQGKLPEQTVFIPIDVLTQDAYEAVVNHGFMVQEKSFHCLMGLLMYCRPEEVEQLFSLLSKLCVSGSEVVFDCFDETTFSDQNSTPGFKQWLAQGKLTGEVFQSLWSKKQLERLALEQGFSMKTYLDPSKIEQLYFSQGENAYHACEHVQYVKFMKL